MQLFFLCACCLALLTRCRQTGEQSVYYLPHHFTGNAIIVFDQAGGTPTEYREGRRVYRIPSTGILYSQFTPNYGWHQADEYWYTDAQQQPLKKLRYIDRIADAPQLAPDTICCHRVPVTDSNTPRTHYLTFVVSPFRAVDSIHERQVDALFRLGNEFSSHQ